MRTSTDRSEASRRSWAAARSQAEGRTQAGFGRAIAPTRMGSHPSTHHRGGCQSRNSRCRRRTAELDDAREHQPPCRRRLTPATSRQPSPRVQAAAMKPRAQARAHWGKGASFSRHRPVPTAVPCTPSTPPRRRAVGSADWAARTRRRGRDGAPCASHRPTRTRSLRAPGSEGAGHRGPRPGDPARRAIAPAAERRVASPGARRLSRVRPWSRSRRLDDGNAHGGVMWGREQVARGRARNNRSLVYNGGEVVLGTAGRICVRLLVAAVLPWSAVRLAETRSPRRRSRPSSGQDYLAFSPHPSTSHRRADGR
jgi:hypothetical protein